MSTLSCDVLTDAASLITRGDDGFCSFLFLIHPRPHVHLFLHKHKQRIYVRASGPGARPLTQRPKCSDLRWPEKEPHHWPQSHQAALLMGWIFKCLLISLVEGEGGLLKTSLPTDGPQGPICWWGKQKLNDASQNDLAFKDPRQVVSNDGICTKSKHSILDMIYRLSELEALP